MTTVARTCTELQEGDGTGLQRRPSRPLAEYRERDAYVLLGDPGMGKTTAFKTESRAVGDALKVKARDFVNFDAEDHPEWQGKTLFIDGLDEVRTGQSDPRTPFDRVRRNLDKLGKPPFRLSCRHADWLTTDQKNLEATSPSGDVTVLQIDPLDERMLIEILGSDSRVPNAQDFIDEAHKRGVEGLLANPQCLDMLIDAVHGGAWPASRADTFEKACLAMAREHNREHLSVRPIQDPQTILKLAGRICAALLVSGVPGCATSVARVGSDFPDVAELRTSHGDCHEAISSKLFRHPEEGRATPVHRHVAEYLAGRYLASLIDGGMPTARVLALICGRDGKVVSELRGLSAWLAAHSHRARHHLIERDPVGVALYGDIAAFAHYERRALLRTLVREPRQLEPTYRTAPAFASLVTPGMQAALKGALANPPGGTDAPFAVDFVLRLLCEAPPLPDFAPNLLAMARDESRWPRVREAALDAYIHYGGEGNHDSDLLALLHDVRQGRVADVDKQFHGKLLAALYPRRISPSEVWGFFDEDNELFGGAYMRFWVYELPSGATDFAVAGLLDACAARLPELEPVSTSRLARCVGRLLARGLETHGDSMDIAHLYRWLDAGVRLRVAGDGRGETGAIRSWITSRPEFHADLMLEGVRRMPDGYWYAPYEATQRLFGAEVSAEFYEACVREAKASPEPRHAIADSLLRFALQTGGLDTQRARDLLKDDTRLLGVLDELLRPAAATPELARLEQAQQVRAEEEQRRQARARGHLEKNEEALRNNQAHPAVLYGIARAYFGEFMGFTPERGSTHLRRLAGPNHRLLEALEIGLVRTVDREDVPDLDTVLHHRLKSEVHYLCWPYLAGLAERERASSLSPAWWTEERMRKALAAYFAYAHGDYEPDWYRHLVAEHASTVADVQVQLASALLNNRIDSNTNLWDLAFDRGHAAVAAHASLPLLRQFPVGASNASLRSLEYLLLAAYQHVERRDFKELIAGKLAQKSMPPRQRGRWIAAGCAIASDQFAPEAIAFADGGRRQMRALHLAAFFCPQERVARPIRHNDTCLLALLIGIVGRSVGPNEHREGIVTPAMESSDLVTQCINGLAGNPDARASDALSDLLGDARLPRWHQTLARAAAEQHVVRRDHEFSHPTFDQVVQTLDGGPPTNPADLAALTVDVLAGLAKEVRDGDTSDWRQYWDGESPQRETECRNRFLSDLRLHLDRYGVRADPEVQHADDKRADFRVSFEGFHVPVEVKTTMSQDLWSAIRDQLIPGYTRDPKAAGTGIFLVFWFGTQKWKKAPSGERLQTPEELRDALEKTLSHEQARLISICVVDVSSPLDTA